MHKILILTNGLIYCNLFVNASFAQSCSGRLVIPVNPPEAGILILKGKKTEYVLQGNCVKIGSQRRADEFENITILVNNRFKKSSGIAIKKAFYLISSHRKFAHNDEFQISTGRGLKWFYPRRDGATLYKLPNKRTTFLRLGKLEWNQSHNAEITPVEANNQIKRLWHAYFSNLSADVEAHSVFDNKSWKIPEEMTGRGWKVTNYLTTFPLRIGGKPENQRIFNTPIPDSTKKLFIRIRSNMPFAEDWRKTIIFE